MTSTATFKMRMHDAMQASELVKIAALALKLPEDFFVKTLNQHVSAP